MREIWNCRKKTDFNCIQNGPPEIVWGEGSVFGAGDDTEHGGRGGEDVEEGGGDGGEEEGEGDR